MTENFIDSAFTKKDQSFELCLRPEKLSEFIGQYKLQKQLDIVIKAALQRKDPLGHMLFCGPPGLGKTTLAHIIAKTMQTKLVVTSGLFLKSLKI